MGPASGAPVHRLGIVPPPVSGMLVSRLQSAPIALSHLTSVAAAFATLMTQSSVFPSSSLGRVNAHHRSALVAWLLHAEPCVPTSRARPGIMRFPRGFSVG